MSERRMRILLVAQGFAEYATRLAAALAESDDVLLIRSRRNARNELTGLDIPLPPHALVIEADFNPIWRFWLRAPALVAAIRRFRPDVIHIQETPHVFNRVVIRAAGRAPLLLTVHDPVPHEGADTAKAQAGARVMRIVRRAANGILVHGAFCRVAYATLSEARGKRLFEVDHGVILAPTRGQCHPPEAGRILFFGRMERYKGLDLLLDVAERRPALAFHVAGRGPELERLARRLVALPNVTVTDRFLAPAEVIDAFQRAEILALPYRSATQSGVVAAGFANGRPAVAFAVGGLVDVVSDGVDGLLVPAADVEAFAAALDAAAPLAAGALASATGRFAWSEIARETRAAYRALIVG